MNDETPTVHFNDRTGNRILDVGLITHVFTLCSSTFLVDKRFMRSAIRRWAGRLSIVGMGLLTTLVLIASLVMLRFLPRLPFGRRLILKTGLLAGAGGGWAPESDISWLGKSGTALSPLRPAGIAELEGTRVDVVSEGDLIEPGAPVVVTRVDGNRIVVRRHRVSTESD